MLSNSRLGSASERTKAAGLPPSGSLSARGAPGGAGPPRGPLPGAAVRAAGQAGRAGRARARAMNDSAKMFSTVCAKLLWLSTVSSTPAPAPPRASSARSISPRFSSISAVAAASASVRSVGAATAPTCRRCCRTGARRTCAAARAGRAQAGAGSCSLAAATPDPIICLWTNVSLAATRTRWQQTRIRGPWRCCAHTCRFPQQRAT